MVEKGETEEMDLVEFKLNFNSAKLEFQLNSNLILIKPNQDQSGIQVKY